MAGERGRGTSVGMVLRRVATVSSPVKEPKPAMRGVTADLVVDGDLDGILDGIEEFSHLLVLCWAHLIPPERRSITRVHPMGREDLPLLGIFSTHSPARPNPILATVVRLVERKGNVLRVEGMDAIDGTPVIDIKPFTRGICPEREITEPEWLTEAVRQSHQQA